MSAIEKLKSVFGQQKLFGGNCGTMALAIAEYLPDPKPNIVIFCEEGDMDEAEPNDIAAADLLVYHVCA